MAKKNKPFRPKARRPRGFEDRPADVIRAEASLVAKAFAVYDSFGFEPLQTPAFEYADALGKFLPDEDRPNVGVFALQDDDEQWLSLRYDLTAPLARFVAEHYDAIPKPYRRYQAGSVFRNEKPGPGRFREFTQCDADTVGAGGAVADAEMIMVAAEIARAAGLRDDQYAVRVNNRKLLDGILEASGVPNTDAGATQRLQVLRAIDKLDRLGEDGVEALLGEGREDESGDYTQGARLTAHGIKAVLGFTTASADRETTIATLSGLVGGSDRGKQGVDELAEIDRLLTATGFGPERVSFDTSVVRGLGYYTGPVFELELLAEITDKKGRPVRVGSIGGGGRYDDLVSRFRGQPVPATGFSFGVSRFVSALERMDAMAVAAQPPVLITVFDRGLLPHYFKLAAELRAADIRAEVFTGSGNVTKQLKYADRRGVKLAVLIGSDEAENGQVTIKDLFLGAEMAKAIETNEEWKSTRPAQQTVARDHAVAAIREMMAEP
ncbi:histidine--tRNA ligase [Algimonas porphyrae]|uniref:Histidine--tRNA ligase n=1 Tax=Algimonas porphyrae TaxID=1128113 RepID=A0ABQ5V2L8_9PROT|nr:histidine--tRNA ligase [Algimonas porphyrae]GLQ21098.1 histidine--tRNA ligase [Algimonas porphyrae]